MGIGNIEIPTLRSPLGYSPFSAVPTPAQVAVQAAGALSLTLPASVVLVPGGVPFTIMRDVTNAELSNMSAAAAVITMLPAPGAGFNWQILYAWAALIKTIASGGPAPTFRVRYTGVATDLVAAFVSDLANARSFYSPSQTAVTSIATTPTENLAVELSMSGGGIGASNAIARVGLTAFKRTVAAGGF